MAYTTDRYPQLKKRSEQSDLLKETEDAFYGGGQGGPRPTPTPKPTPRPTSLAMLGQPIGLGTSGNGASRINGLTNPTPDETAYPTNTGSQYIGPGGTPLGPQYNQEGKVNPLPRGAAGVQGSQGFNRSLNGAQPQQNDIPTPGRPMTHTELASDIINRNLTAAGSTLGTSQVPSSYGGPSTYTITPEGNIDTNVPGGSVEDALARMSRGEVFSTNAASRVSQTDLPQQNEQAQAPQRQTQSNVDPMIEELNQAGIRPGRYADALPGTIQRSGTGFSYPTATGKVDIAGPMHFAAVRKAVEQNQGYGSAYGY